MIKKIDLYEGDISNLVKNKKPEEVLNMLIDAVDKDVKFYFGVSVENFDRFEEINDIKDWVNAYWENLHWHLSEPIKKFIDDNGYDINALMVNSYDIFKELVEKAREMFPDGIENDL